MTRQDLRNAYPTFTAAQPVYYSPSTNKPLPVLRTLAYLAQSIVAIVIAHVLHIL